MALLSSPWKLVSSTPPATRAFTFLVLLASGLHAYLLTAKLQAPASSSPKDSFLPYLTLVPGASIWFPWTLISAAFVEISIFELILTLLLVPFSLRYLERLWGTIETIKFTLITVAISNLIAFGLSWLEFYILGNARLILYATPYHGMMALQAGVLVAFTQIIPEHSVQFFRSVAIRVKRLPMLYVTISNIAVILGYQSPFILIQFGWLVSWFYLRFYKRNHESDTWGDRSETFAFVSWFPPIVHYPLGLVCTAVHSTALKLHVIPSSTDEDLESGGYAPVPGGTRAEAERRRAMALKALDQRLASASPAAGGSSAPSASRPAPSTSAPAASTSQDPPRTSTGAKTPEATADKGGKAKEGV